MNRFEFESWDQRLDNAGLRDAWIASERQKANCDWSAFKGTCGVCGIATGFSLEEAAAEPDEPNLRENLLCDSCRHNSRVRAGIELLSEHIAPIAGHARVYLTEQVTATYIWLQNHLEGQIFGSEFEPDPARLEELTRSFQAAGGNGDVRFEDVTALRFADRSLDAVVSFDVLEHVPDYRTALGEFARVLRPGGVCIATFPFIDREETVTRAIIDDDGEIRHLLEPEYHGDPISGGVLCFYHFGWDVLDDFRRSGFEDVRMIMPFDHSRGYFYGLWTLVATR